MKRIISVQVKNKINIFLYKYFNLVVLCIVVIILTFGYLSFIKPKYDQINNEYKTASVEEDSKYLERKKYLKQLEDLKQEYQEISVVDIEKIKIMLPEEDNHEELFAQFEDIILKNGLLLTSLSISEVESKLVDTKALKEENDSAEDSSSNEGILEIKTILVSLSFLGTDYEGLKNILSILENNLRLFDINSLSFNPGGNSTSLELYTYFLEKDELDN